MGREDAAGSAPSGEPQLIAHRGYAAENPENTVAAMRAAANDDRTDAIEIDVRATRDERVIVFHDDDLSRLTDAPPAVCDTPIRELSYDEISGHTVDDSDESIPLLADALAAIPESRTVNIELKQPGCEGLQFGAVDEDARTAAAARWRPFVDRVLDIAADTAHEILYSSFYEGALAAANNADPGLAVAPLVADSAATAVALAGRYDATAVHPSIDLVVDTDLVATAHDAGYRVNAWTATNPADATVLATAGVDGIIADTPAVVAADNL
jgi:glycerophosphoryl diester phosphodiesterase